MDWTAINNAFYPRFQLVSEMCERKHIKVECGSTRKYHKVNFHCGEKNANYKQIIAEMRLAFPNCIIFRQKQKRTVMHVPYAIQ